MTNHQFNTLAALLSFVVAGVFYDKFSSVSWFFIGAGLMNIALSFRS